MKRFVYTNDFVFHAQREAPRVFHEEIFELLQIPLESGTQSRLEMICGCKNQAGEIFSRKRFLGLSGFDNVPDTYFACDLQKISAASVAYFKSFFDNDTVFIGCELGLELRNWLTQNGYAYVNFWYHPFKLLDDIFFLVGSNVQDVYDMLMSCRVDRRKLEFHARYYSLYARHNKMVRDAALEDNCCLFIGQLPRDKSVQDGERFLTIADFPEKIAELESRYSRIYYLPHPKLGKNNVVGGFLAAHDRISELKGIPTYCLLASEKVKKVIALSSSVVYEAKMFGKDSEYLFRPLFDIDGPYSLNSFVSIYHDYFRPSFWKSVMRCLAGEPALSVDGIDDELMDFGLGRIRDLAKAQWGYKYLGRLERLENRLERIEHNPLIKIGKQIKKLFCKAGK